MGSVVPVVDHDEDPLAFFIGFSLSMKLALIFWLSVALAVLQAF